MGLKERIHNLDKWGWLAILVVILFSFVIGFHVARHHHKPFLINEESKANLRQIAKQEVKLNGNYSVTSTGSKIRTSSGVKNIAHVYYSDQNRNSLLVIDLDTGQVVFRSDSQGWMLNEKRAHHTREKWLHERYVFKDHKNKRGHPFIGLLIVVGVLYGIYKIHYGSNNKEEIEPEEKIKEKK